MPIQAAIDAPKTNAWRTIRADLVPPCSNVSYRTGNNGNNDRKKKAFLTDQNGSTAQRADIDAMNRNEKKNSTGTDFGR